MQISYQLPSHVPQRQLVKATPQDTKTAGVDSFQVSTRREDLLALLERVKRATPPVLPAASRTAGKKSNAVEQMTPIDGRRVLEVLRSSGILRAVPMATLSDLFDDMANPRGLAAPVQGDGEWMVADRVIREARVKDTREATEEEIREVLEERDGNQYKEDQYPEIDTTGAQPGAPSYRVDGNIHASGQPTKEALREILERATANGEKPVWVNLREEPVLYIDGRPHNVRVEDFKNLSGDEMSNRYPWVKELMDQKGVSNYSDLSVEDKRAVVERLESEEKQRLLDEIDAPPKGYVLLHDEVVNADGKAVPRARWVEMSPEDVQTTQEVVEELKVDFEDLEYHRLPVTDEHSPSPEVYDLLTEIGRDENNAILVNCHAGRGRTSTALAILKTVQNSEEVSGMERVLQVLSRTHPVTALLGLVRDVLNSKLSVDELADRLQITDPDTREMLTHLREQIGEARREGKEEKVQDFEQRYARLLLFGVYLKSGSSQTFSDWLESRGWLENVLEALPLEGSTEQKAA